MEISIYMHCLKIFKISLFEIYYLRHDIENAFPLVKKNESVKWLEIQ